VNALTIDLEDWRQLVHRKMTGEEIAPVQDVVDETHAILSLLEARATKATFFVLANIAETYPDLVRSIADSGHEVASHGWSHQLLPALGPDTFRSETRRARSLLEAVTGRQVVGYRAAEFSATSWSAGILAEEGFAYDSSRCPTGRASDESARPRTVRIGDRSLVEFPVLTHAALGRRWGLGGGGSLHVAPASFVSRAVERAGERGVPAVVYLHPYDVTTRRLRTVAPARTSREAVVRVRHSLPHNIGRRHAMRTLERLLERFSFGPLISMLSTVEE